MIANMDTATRFDHNGPTGESVIMFQPFYMIYEVAIDLEHDVKRFEDKILDLPSFSMPEPNFDPMPVMPNIRKIYPAGKFLPYVLNRRMMFSKSGWTKK